MQSRIRRQPRTVSLCILALVLAASSVPGPSAAQEPVEYEISFPNRLHHEARVELTLPAVEPGVVEVRMSRSSPGRYALHEFAKNVYGVTARDGADRPLRVSRASPHAWRISVPEGREEVRFSYVLYGDRVDGTYTAVDETHAHLNMPATFAWAPGWESRPIRLEVEVPEGSGWRVATQLFRTDRQHVFAAPDLDYFLDSPTEVSSFALDAWEVDGPAQGATIRVALHHRGSEEARARYVDGVRAIVRETAAVWGELPDFEDGRYTFLADYLPWADGDGMEHRNSTILTSSASLDRARLGLLGTVAHEFFHAWNVERIRPASLEPFDFTRANMSGALWFAEGFTSYYDDLILVRAGLIDLEGYADRLGRTLDAVINAPGRRLRSPVEMSRQAPFVDAAVSVDPTNRPNTFLSYYTWGSAVALGLDLELRAREDGTTLDDYMRALWSRFGRTEVPYTVADLERTLAEVTGDADFARDFFRRFVRGREVPEYRSLLEPAGLEMGRARPDAAYLTRAPLAFGEDGFRIRGPTRVGSPLHRVGADRGDRVVSVAGRTPTSRDELDAILADRPPGESVTVAWISRGRRQSAEVRLDGDPTVEVVPVEEGPGAGPGSAERSFRRAWLSPKASR